MSDKRKKLMIFGAVVLLAAVGAIVGVIVARDSSDDASTGDGTSSAASDSTSSSTGSNAGTVHSDGSSTGSSSSNSTGSSSTITSDPTTATYSLAAFAVGDWGTTVSMDSCCSDSSTYTDFDIIAEDVVAALMNLQAGDAEVKPTVIIGHGDNFYWTGINDDVDTRFDTTFEKKFNGDNIIDIPWVNVMGNHDYGGSSYICLDGTSLAECSSTDAMLTALEKKFTWQQEYTSSNNDRWKLTDHFYKYTISDDASGVSIDIFNIDTNDANTHGAQEICCQCYGYAEGDDDACDNIARGDKFCCGGDTDMYDKCVAKITEWADDSRTQLKTEVAASKATWKIVNSHYSPYVHYDESGQTEWFDILKESGVQVWMNGHTHGEKHDFAESLSVHFVENGAGGGIVKQSASGIPTYSTAYVSNVWSYGGQEYGFFSITASKEWLKLQYHTANTDWNMGSTLSDTTIGTVATKHCWYIPVDGSEGKTCDS